MNRFGSVVRRTTRTLYCQKRCLGTEPHPMRKLFPAQPDESKPLDQDFELIWDDGQAPEHCLDQHEGFSTQHAITMLGLGLLGFFGLYKVAEMTDRQSPAILREFKYGAEFANQSESFVEDEE